MAIIAIMHAPDLTKAQYDSLRPEVQWEKDYPAGLLLHSCAFDEKGGMHVVDIWQSGEEMQEFFASRLLPAMQKLGINPPQPSIMPAHNIDAFPGIEMHTPMEGLHADG